MNKSFDSNIVRIILYNRRLYIQTLIKDRKVKLVTSYMLRYECSNNPYEMRRNAIFDFISNNTYAYIGDERKVVIEAKAAEIMKTGVIQRCRSCSFCWKGRETNPLPGESGEEWTTLLMVRNGISSCQKLMEFLEQKIGMFEDNIQN